MLREERKELEERSRAGTCSLPALRLHGDGDSIRASLTPSPSGDVCTSVCQPVGLSAIVHGVNRLKSLTDQDGLRYQPQSADQDARARPSYSSYSRVRSESEDSVGGERAHTCILARFSALSKSLCSLALRTDRRTDCRTRWSVPNSCDHHNATAVSLHILLKSPLLRTAHLREKSLVVCAWNCGKYYAVVLLGIFAPCFENVMQCAAQGYYCFIFSYVTEL